MACPTCGHTLQGVGETTDGRRHWHCPRCGTLRSEAGNHADTWAPALVDRCREFVATLGPAWTRLAHKLGLVEAIYPPDRRPTL